MLGPIESVVIRLIFECTLYETSICSESVDLNRIFLISDLDIIGVKYSSRTCFRSSLCSSQHCGNSQM